MNHCNHQIPTLSMILDALSLSTDSVIAIYLYGSHLWGECHDRSDVDLIIVMKNNRHNQKLTNIHRNNIDATILSEDDYLANVDQMSMQFLITCWLPDYCVILRPPYKKISINKKKFADELEKTIERDLRIAKKHHQKQNLDQSQKVIIHLIRYLLLARQIRQSNRIIDYSCGEEFMDLKMQIIDCYLDLNQNTDHRFSSIESMVDRIDGR